MRPQQLARSLANASPAPVYLITGDETLLVQQAWDTVLARLRELGFEERSTHHVDNTFRWGDLLQDMASTSLFAERRIVDLRVPGARFDREASDTLRGYLKALDTEAVPDTVLMIRTGQLERRQRDAAWFKAIDAAGVVVLVWPVGVDGMPRWLAEELSAQGLDLSEAAERFLREHVEGNLLAAVQALEKLRLADLPAPIEAEQVAAIIEDSSHYSSFELVDAVFAGDTAHVSRMLRGLRDEGVSLFAVLGAFTSQLRLIQTNKVPNQRRGLARKFMQRVKRVEPVLAQCALIDQQGKGELHGDAWLSLENLLLRLAGLRERPLPEEELTWRRRT